MIIECFYFFMVLLFFFMKLKHVFVRLVFRILFLLAIVIGKRGFRDIAQERMSISIVCSGLTN